jgi:hypothetical protein
LAEQVRTGFRSGLKTQDIENPELAIIKYQLSNNCAVNNRFRTSKIIEACA